MTAHSVRSHAIELAVEADAAFPMFTPLGEIDWVEGWEPEFLHPADGATGDGMVFRTRHDGEETLWACVDWRPAERRVRYVRVTPGSRFAFVAVAVEAIGARRCRVRVDYTTTALSPAGAETMAAVTPERFRAGIEGWRTALERCLSAERGPS